MAYLNLEHKLVELFKSHSFSPNILVCASGGVDSMALLSALTQLQKQFQLNLQVIHVHHGMSQSETQTKFRDQCAQLVQNECEKLGVPLHCNCSEKEGLTFSPEKQLSSEAEFRGFREAYFAKVLTQNPGYQLALAHHQQDLLETRLIQLIRGSGVDGFLSLKLQSQNKLRPFINVSKQEILTYAKARNVNHFEDPSNTDSKYLRNWMRTEWLPTLESFRPGSVKTLSNSLDNLADELFGKEAPWLETWAKVYNAESRCLNLTSLWLLSRYEQRKCIATLLKKNLVNLFSKNQIDEVLKRLDSPEKVHKFDMLELTWSVGDNELTVGTN